MLKEAVRIVGGELRGRTISAPKGTRTRPTSDKVRQAIFNILQARSEPPAQALDLFAGSGALGLEAASRGVQKVCLVERDRATCAVIEGNVARLGLGARCQVVHDDVLDFLQRAPAAPAGWIFLDPPYADVDKLERAVQLIADRDWAAPSSMVVVEHDAELPDSFGWLCRLVDRRYGDTTVSVYSGGV
jgi:16S rRNA (guanine966-N2)-methyltransferase